jgi:hypothetical protein
MQRISSYSELETYLESHPQTGMCWYGPRSSDVSGLRGLVRFAGIISCYGADESLDETPLLSTDVLGRRRNCGIDDLAKMRISDGNLLRFIGKNGITAILPYGTTPELEEFCRLNSVACLSSSDSLKGELRDKTRIDSISWEIGLPAIPGISGRIEELEYAPLAVKLGLPLFLQFVEGARGTGNYIVSTEPDFERIKTEKHGKRLNVKKHVAGRSCSIDICVTPTSVLCGPLEEMLIGAEPLNSNPTEYVGSSWFENDYSQELRSRICAAGVALGELLRARGFLGFFHPDFLVDGDDVFLTELNMRFGASCGVYSKIQVAMKQVPLMLAHVLAFRDPDLAFDVQRIQERNLEPLSYALLVLKNNFGKPVHISRGHASGIYRVLENGIEATGRQAFQELKDKDEIFLIGLPDPEEETHIEEGAFICEVVTRFPVSDTRSKLTPEGKSLARTIFSEIVSERHEGWSERS